MKSRMEKYYKDEELMQRTSKNDSLYEELYREKKEPTSNVTVLDNVKEIDIAKIKELVDSRENYKKVREYENLVQKNQKRIQKEEYLFEEIDDSNYDINMIIEKKKNDPLSEDDLSKIRKITNTQFNLLDDLKIESDTDIEKLTNSNNESATDLFANLKEDNDEAVEEKEEVVKEQTFYTKSNSFDQKDFNENFIEEENNSNILLIIITIFVLLMAVGIFVWFKFFQ